MSRKRNIYRANYLLIIAFICGVTISLIVAVFLARNLTIKYVENEFFGRKTEVLEHNLISFNDFFQNRLPEISYYQGYLDSTIASQYAYNLLRTYPFVETIKFYDILLCNDHNLTYGFSLNDLVIHPKGVYQFFLAKTNGDTVLAHQQYKQSSQIISDEFNTMAIKLASFLESLDTNRIVYDEHIFRVFYSVVPGKISYTNIPRAEDLKNYKELIHRSARQEVKSYEQDLLTFYINPQKLSIENTIPKLYQEVSIRPLVYEKFSTENEQLVTDSPLPGALADYKLYFSASQSYLSHEINRRFLPVLSGVIAIYLFLLLIAYLIFRNLNVNKRMFKLQYDFITNFTHEFKTPVSVIKIAGNNIQNAKSLSDVERHRYGKILDIEADKLNNLMNTLLSFTQIENKSIKIKREQVNLHEFCEDIIAASKLKYSDLSLTVKLKRGITFYTDPVLLGSIFQNLIDNAYKYSSPAQRYLKIEIKEIKKNITMTFADKGIGIAKNELTNIFKKFYRVQNQYNQQGSVGLGLAFCKELVNFMGGNINVNSVINEGTVFTINFPTEQTQQKTIMYYV